MCLSCPSRFVLSKLLLLCFLLGYPQQRGLPTFGNSNSYWGFTVLHTHTFQRGPNGAGNRKWSNLPQPVSELWFIHTRVSGNRCGKTKWKRNWGEIGKEDNIYSSLSLREKATWTHCHFFTSWHNKVCLLAVWHSILSIFTPHPTDTCLSGIPCILCVQMLVHRWGLRAAPPAFFIFNYPGKVGSDCKCVCSNALLHIHAVVRCLKKTFPQPKVTLKCIQMKWKKRVPWAELRTNMHLLQLSLLDNRPNIYK